jgi:hypothetical protein
MARILAPAKLLAGFYFSRTKLKPRRLVCKTVNWKNCLGGISTYLTSKPSLGKNLFPIYKSVNAGRYGAENKSI